MKLRVRANSLRLRLTRGEVASLGEAGCVAERICFPTGEVMEYRLEADADCTACTASFDGNVIRVQAPRSAVDRWVSSDEVAVRQNAASSPDESNLTVLIEKDFACLTERPGEDDSDAYPHPGEC